MEVTQDAKTFWTYNLLDTVTTAKVYYGVDEELGDLSLRDFYHTVVHPLTLAVRRMANRGMYRDDRRYTRLQNVYDEKIRRYAEGLQAVVKRPTFNPNSTEDVRAYIYGELGLKSGKKTKAGKDSVDQLSLLRMGLRHDSTFFKLLLCHRKLSKLRGTYLTKGYLSKDGRIRSRFLVHGTATGRLSSREPNFQNIPKEKNAWFGLNLPNIRTIFTSEPGNVLIEADYSQLELRLIAYASGCRRMLDAYENNGDVHMATAMSITGKPASAVTTEERDFAKRFRFCQNYGGGAKKISEILFSDAGIIKSVRDCEEVLFKLKLHEPEVFSWRDRVLEQARRTHMIHNEFGRIRITFTRDDDLAGVAYNTPIQSTAADLINLAFIRLDALGVPMVNQVHDAIITECPEHDVERTVVLMKQEMERPVDIFGRKGLIFPVDIKVGTRWGALKKWSN